MSSPQSNPVSTALDQQYQTADWLTTDLCGFVDDLKKELGDELAQQTQMVQQANAELIGSINQQLSTQIGQLQSYTAELRNAVSYNLNKQVGYLEQIQGQLGIPGVPQQTPLPKPPQQSQSAAVKPSQGQAVPSVAQTQSTPPVNKPTGLPTVQQQPTATQQPGQPSLDPNALGRVPTPTSQPAVISQPAATVIAPQSSQPATQPTAPIQASTTQQPEAAIASAMVLVEQLAKALPETGQSNNANSPAVGLQCIATINSLIQTVQQLQVQIGQQSANPVASTPPQVQSVGHRSHLHLSNGRTVPLPNELIIDSHGKVTIHYHNPTDPTLLKLANMVAERIDTVIEPIWEAGKRNGFK